MSMRGTQVRSEQAWRSAEYKLGKTDGFLGRPAIHANESYQRGYRVGVRHAAQQSAEPEKERVDDERSG